MIIRTSRIAAMLLGTSLAATVACQTVPTASPAATTATAIDRDLMDVTVERLHQLYDGRRYTVKQVIEWHLARIERYNGVYGAIETVFRERALSRAAEEDAELASGGTAASHGALWGVPIVIKANTSIEGEITSAGWRGFRLPGFELVAPRDATIVGKMKSAGAIVVGHTNMPDLAASDTNRSSAFGRTGNAYDVRFSPGGSSGGTVTAVAANFAVLGNGTDTGNSIRMPAATSALVGVYPTRGLVSIAGIAPLDWLLDNTGPIARTVADAAVALDVMRGEDPLDARTQGSRTSAPATPLANALSAAALKGKRFGVPAFVLAGDGVPFHGIPFDVPASLAERIRRSADTPLLPETREAFMKAVEMLRAAGAEVIFDESILATDFARTVSRIATYAYTRDGTDQFLAEFGPAAYKSSAAYQRVVGRPLFPSSIGSEEHYRQRGTAAIEQRSFARDPEAERMYHAPRRAALAAYLEPLDRLKLDGYVYPAIQMPPVDETMPQDGSLSEGPHSDTSWVNMIGVPAIVVPAGFYASGLPFGLEFAGRLWSDRGLLDIAYGWEQTTHLRRPPVLVDRGLLATMPAHVR